jgi:P pilus assembly chaperone PapD
MNIFKCLTSKVFRCTFIYSLLIFSFQVASSVTMIGSRIVYPEGGAGINVEFNNPDKIPYAVQGWFDSGDEKSTPQTGKAPFMASPELFRIMPDNGQVMRVLFTGNSASLPQDRESMFYFNFLQIPPINTLGDAENKNNKMLIMLRNRVKIFYRPKKIIPLIKSAPDLINVKLVPVSGGIRVQIKNSSAFYLSLVSITLRDANKELRKKAQMISPFSESYVTFKEIGNMKNIVTIIDYVNDHGARVKKEYAGI